MPKRGSLVARSTRETGGVKAAALRGSGDVTPVGVAAGKGFFVGPVLRATDAPLTCDAMNDHEIFGPVATLGRYDGDPVSAAAVVTMAST